MTIGPLGPADHLQDLKNGPVEGPRERLKAATTLFESTFYQELFKVMRETVPDGSTSGAGEEVFTSMLDEHVAGEAAAQQEDGLGAALYRRFVEFIR
ncbi:MAG: rod-binding protein [Gemmatimonadota bacterium]|nr:rod-binding protein [Gemmatimonadota bacterium]